MPFVIEPRPYDDPDVVDMVAEVQAEYVRMYGGPDAAVIGAGEFSPPLGLLLVGSIDGVAVATGGWRFLDRNAGVAELKRLYVRPTLRRRGLSRVMLAEVERTAMAAGAGRLVLNTGSEQRAAIALYLDSGYGPAEPFGLYAGQDGALFYGKTMAAAISRG